MNDLTMASLVEIGTSLTTLAVKGTVSAVSSKVKAIKMEKDVETIKNKYDEIINELLSEREEAIRIAQVYKSELERIEISDEDNHLHNTVESTRNIKVMVNNTNENYEQSRSLLACDTLKTSNYLG